MPQIQIGEVTYIYNEPTHRQRRDQIRAFTELVELESAYGEMIAAGQADGNFDTVDGAVARRNDHRMRLFSDMATMLNGMIEKAHRSGEQLKLDDNYWDGIINDGMGLSGGEVNDTTVFARLFSEIFGDLAGAGGGDGRSPAGKKKASPTDSESTPDAPTSPDPAGGANDT